MEAELQSQNPIVPLFLLKTFSILETADPNIVCWSDAGDSFLVKDPESFSSGVIPFHFKHNKFSSFVRQLNFYGFRKVKGKLNFIGMSEQHSWEFKHPHFLRGQPDMLTHIKRSSYHGDDTPVVANSAPEESSVVESLQQQVRELTSKMELLSKSVTDMQKIIAHYQAANSSTLSNNAENIEPTTSAESSDTEAAVENWDIDDDELLMTFLEDLNDGPVPVLQISPEPVHSLKRDRSMEEDIESFDEPARQVARNTQPAGVISREPAVVQAVASAVALSNSSNGSDLSAMNDQYIAAVAAILSCAGMSQAQALAASAAVMSQTGAIKNLNDMQVSSQLQKMISL